MAEPADGEEFRRHWLPGPASFLLYGRDPSAPPSSIERRRGQSGGQEVSGAAVPTRLGTTATPDVVLAGEPFILALVAGPLSAARAADLGLRARGDVSALELADDDQALARSQASSRGVMQTGSPP